MQMVISCIFEVYPLNSALFGLVSYNDLLKHVNTSNIEGLRFFQIKLRIRRSKDSRFSESSSSLTYLVVYFSGILEIMEIGNPSQSYINTN